MYRIHRHTQRIVARSFDIETSKKATLERLKFYANGFYRDAIFADSPKIEGIEGNQDCREGEIRRNPATIALAKIFTIIAGSSAIYRVFVDPFVDQRFSIIPLLANASIFSPHGRTSRIPPILRFSDFK